jgi:acetyl esterase/lipase
MPEIHPDLRRIARLAPRGGISPRLLPPLRGVTGLMSKSRGKGVQRIKDGSVEIRLHRPPGATSPGPALLWIHGGGYVLGSPAQDDANCRDLAARLGIVVAAVRYRLAPKNPFPAPLEDCFDGLTWLAKQSYVDALKLAVGGASAGGGLAAAVALLARDRGVPLAFQLLVYPMVDDRTALRTDIDESSFRLWNNKANAFGWRAYTGQEPGAANQPLNSVPARVESLAGLAPAWIGVGNCDLFHDEDLAYAARLREAGVPCDVEVVDGAFHGFDAIAAKTPVVKAFRDSQVKALAAALS